MFSYNEYNVKLHEERETTLDIFYFFIFYNKCLESFSNRWTRLCSFVNKSLDSRIPRGARTYTWCHSLTARHPFGCGLGFWLTITPIIMLPMRRRTKSSRASWMARSLARESQKRHGCLVAQLPVILPL